jgi:hypothetical protein
VVLFVSDSSQGKVPDRVDESGGSKSGGSSQYRPSRDPTILFLGLIVVASVVAMLTGVGISIHGGTGSGPVFPFPEGGENETLQLSVNRTTVPVGEDVSVTVMRANTTPVENATVRVDEDRYRTGPNGTAVVSLSSPGEYEIVARPPNKNESTLSASTTIQVQKRLVDLDMATNRSTIDVGGSVRVSLTKGDDGQPVNGTVAVGDRTLRTGPNGHVVIPFDRGGPHRLVGRKTATEETRYGEASTTVQVSRRVASLELQLAKETISYGNATTVTVTRNDTGEPITAEVTVGNRTVRTGDDGKAAIRSLRPGSYTVRATAEPSAEVRFEPAATRVRVSRRTVPLEIVAEPQRPSVGNETTITVRRTDTGEPVAATVEVADRVLRTGSDGQLSVALDQPGEYRVVARRANTSTETFEPFGMIVVWAGPDLQIASIDLSTVVGAQERLPIAVTVVNRGNEVGETSVTATMVGDRQGSRQVRIQPGESRTIDLSVLAPDRPGYYLVGVTPGKAWHGSVIRVRPSNATANRTAYSDSEASRIGTGAIRHFDADLARSATDLSRAP